MQRVLCLPSVKEAFRSFLKKELFMTSLNQLLKLFKSFLILFQPQWVRHLDVLSTS